MIERKLNDWITGFLEYTKDTESPTSYFFWTAIGIIGAITRRMVFFKRGPEDIYPNNFIALIGPSGKARKGLPITIARSFMEDRRITVFPERITPEELSRESSQITQAFNCKESNKPKFSSTWIVLAEELSVFLREKNTDFMAMLTNMYDSRDSWINATKHQGSDIVLGGFPNIIAASAPSWFPYMFTPTTIGGGFTSRFLFVVEKAKRVTIANSADYPLNEELRDSLDYDLDVIMAANGRFKWSNRAKNLYEEWYNDYDSRFQNGESIIPDIAFDGYTSRRATNVLKIAMCISLSRNSELIMEQGDIQKAITELEKLEKNLPGLFDSVGKSRYSHEISLIKEFMERIKVASKTQLMRALGTSVDRISFEVAIKSLIDQGVLNYEPGTKGNKGRYIYEED